MSKSITAHLTSKTSSSRLYTSATKTHPFLVSAANGTLTDSLLSLWLYQDRIYAAQAYPRFIGSLISRIPFHSLGASANTPAAPAPAATPIAGSGIPPSEAQRILQILVFALQNIVREVNFFDDTSSQHRLDLTRWTERKGTRDYTAEMARVSNLGGLEEGLLFLWAMEKVYLDVWSTIHDELNTTPQSNGEPGALRCFAKNWSTPEFQTFVNDLALLVDDIYKNLDEHAWSLAEGVWQRVLELEQGFWPGALEDE